ncbi:MAG: wax ester/triacylglycerol synthase family O-acyltransferase [Myxococcota bacterium]|nr:wax ester/triacylglycerol synthase family O-acyltransferase [Myxococcota bacterium]
MQRLSGFDATFIYDELPGETQHTLKVSIWSPEASAAHSLAEARRFVRSRLPELPPLRWRALRVPFDLHHPVWVEDPDLDLEHHVRRLAVPAPGGRDELCEVISEIASQPLDPRRPLWELWMLEGYEGGRVVAVLKMSHALADGGETRALIETLYAERPFTPGAGVPEPLPHEEVPSAGRLVRDALRDRLRDLPRLGEVARAALAVRRRVREAREAGTQPELTSLLGSPKTPIRGRIGPRRVFHFSTVPLQEARDIARTFGCTVNDVVLAAGAGALRRYLRHHRALPGLPLVGMMPASIRAENERRSWGNRVTVRPLELPSHIADPVDRLRAAAASARNAKRDLALRRGADPEDWMRWLPPSAPKLVGRAMRALVRWSDRLTPGITVSNVRGPAEVLHAPGGPVENFISVGHVKYAASLNVTVWSYAGQLNFGLYACTDAVPDLPRLSACVVESFEELGKAAAREAARLAA